MAIGDLKDIERQLMQRLSDIEHEHGSLVAVEQYKRLLQQLAEVASERAKTAPPPMAVDPASLHAAVRRVGVAIPANQQVRTRANGDVLLKPQGVFAETRKWHIAAAKVFEFMEAQLNMDLFKDDPEATEIYQAIIMKGFHALHSEGRGL